MKITMVMTMTTKERKGKEVAITVKKSGQFKNKCSMFSRMENNENNPCATKDNLDAFIF